MPRLATALVAATVVLLAACTYESGGETAEESTSTEPANSVAQPSLTSTAPTTAPATTTPAADCAVGGVPGFPPEAGDVSEALGDFDGNGADDLLQVYATSGRDPWRLRVILSTNAAIEMQMPEPDFRGTRAQAVGGADVGDERGDEALVVVQRRSTSVRLGVFVFHDCALDVVRDDDGDPLQLEVGGDRREGHGILCGDGEMTLLSAFSRDGRHFSTTKQVVRTEGTRLVREPEEAGGSIDRERDEGLLRLHYQLSCGTLGVGPQDDALRPETTTTSTTTTTVANG
jgi:hypothetical protein